MPLRTSSGSSASASLAAAAPAAATVAADLANGHGGVAGREGGGARGDRGEARDQTPRLRPAAFGALGQVVGRAHWTHQLEPLLTVGALVLVESHESYLSLMVANPNLYYCTPYEKTV